MISPQDGQENSAAAAEDATSSFWRHLGHEQRMYILYYQYFLEFHFTKRRQKKQGRTGIRGPSLIRADEKQTGQTIVQIVRVPCY